ncbi:MAG: TIGR03118 family protein [Candidatus Binataceae bacterium]
MQTRRILFACLMTLAVAVPVRAAMMTNGSTTKSFYVQTNFDGFGVAAKKKDKYLINPWGLAFGPGTAIWIADNNSGLATLYTSSGKLLKPIVTIPPPSGKSGPAAPTGVVFNPRQSEFGGSLFIFCTEDGTISTWNQSNGSMAQLAVDNSAKNAVYKGIALGTNASGDLLFVADLNNAVVTVFDTNFDEVTVPGGFVDPNLPANFSPFGITNINGNLYVSYAMPDSARTDEVNAAGNGFVDVFDTDGNLIRRLISNGALNSPWGMALAPSNFGSLSGALLVGNFGDGHINAFDPTTGAPVGQLTGMKGQVLVVGGVWSLVFGDGSVGATNTLFFTGGPNNQADGIFGTFTLKTVKSGMGGMMGGGGGGY